ncbi:MAG: T9SS type A sorting domain-containing protein [Sphingobacteriales bacterium]|nr:T9SS type A sorting domain-containing protein [Sphingobacteriales bacterium]
MPGWYEFSDLPVGNYTVTVGSRPKEHLSTDGTVTVTLTPGEIFTDADFGFTLCGANVSDIPDQEICEGDGNIDANLSFPLEPYNAIYGPAPTPAANYTLAYVLTTNSDVIIDSQIMSGAFDVASNTPNFTYSNLAAGVYRMYEIIYRTSDGPLTGLTVGGNIGGINLTTGSCLDATYGNIYVNARPTPQVINNNGSLCEGATITLFAGGGVSYQWQYPNGTVGDPTTSSLLIVSNITVADGGVYTVTVTNADGCTASSTTTVVVNSFPTATAVATNVLCNGTATGGITLTTNGATYLWSNGTTSQDLTGVVAGTYTVTVSNGNCSTTTSATITQPATAVTASATATTTTCGAANGTITVTATGGTVGAGYTYSNGGAFQTSNVFSGLASGNYTITVIDGNDCTTTTTATVGTSTALTASTVATDVNCNGQANGSVNLTVSGATQPYTYAWSNGITTEDLANVAAGTYIVTVTSGTCTTTASATIAQPDALTASAAVNAAGCSGGVGAINLTVNGGNGGYTYLWNNGATTEDISNITAGTYSVLVTDSKNCATTTTATVTQSTPIVVTAVVSKTIACNGETGEVTVSATGGSGTYTSGTGTIISVTAGTYTYPVTDSNGCTGTTTITVTQPTLLTASSVINNATCYGGNGNVDVTVNGGTQAYTYLWSNGATTEDLLAAVAGIYTLTVTDANGCTVGLSATVDEPVRIGITVDSTTPATCGQPNGNVNISVSGGTLINGANYAYNWSNGTTTQDLSNVGAGVYVVTVTDSNGCTATATAQVTTPSGFTAGIVSTQNIACSDGAINVDASGSNLTYAWSGPGGFTASTQDLSGLTTVGTYTLVVTDANNCSISTSATITQANIPINNTGPSCENTVITIGFAGVGPVGTVLNYAWSGPNGYSFTGTYTLTGADIITVSLSNLQITDAGLYTVTITYPGGCTRVASTLVKVDGLPIINSANVTCNGTVGTITVDAESANQINGVEYAIGNGAFQTSNVFSGLANGTYTITVSDAVSNCTTTTSVIVNCAACPVPVASNNGPVCVGSLLSLSANANLPVGVTATYAWAGPAGASTQQNPNLGLATIGKAGTYTVTVTYSNGCTATATTVVVVNAKPVITAATPSCVAGVGRITVTATGTGLTYSIGGAPQASNVFNNVPNGNYTVTVTNAVGCTATASVTVNCVTCPTPVATNNGPVCVGSPINLFVNANLPVGVTATYAWAGPAGSSTLQNPVIVNATPAKAGTYTVTVTYSNGCTATATTVVVVNAKPVITAATPSCVAGVGRITVTATGTGLTYSIGGAPQTSNVFNNVPNGTYTVTVTNAAGCTATASVTVNCVTCPTPVATNNGPVCVGSPINLFVNANLPVGVTATYAWAGPAGTSTLQNPVIVNATPAKAGTYTVTVTYSNGCTATATTVVAVSALPVATISGPASFCAGSSATLIATGGGTYAWSNGGNTASINVTTAGTYTVTVTNASGCTKTATKTVTTTNCCSASVGAVTVSSVVCPGDPFIASAIFNSPATGYTNYILVVDAAGTIVEVVPATSGTQVTLSTSAAGTYNVYAYSIQTPNGGTIPSVGTNVSAISGNCYALSNPPQQVVLPESPLLLVGYQNSDEGYEGGITPFHYNTDTVLVIGGVQPYNFDWEIIGYVRYDINYTETGAEIVIYYSDDAQWNAIVTDSYGCSNDTLLFTNMQGGAAGNTVLDIDSYVVTPSSDYVAPDGTITLNITGGDPSSCAEGYTYEWAGPDTWDGVYGTSTGVPVANGEQYTLTDLPMGWYSVTVTDCSGNVTEGWYWVQSGHRGRTKTDARVTMNVMPNPMSDAATISFVVPTTDNVTVNVYSVDGKQMATLYNDRASADVVYTLPLNAAQLPAGMYFVRLTTASGLTEIQKIVVNR